MDNFNQTMNLPKTDFPMKAGLPMKEPVAVKKWDDESIYEQIIKKNEGKPRFILHDGPPYANASIHMGTAMNKVLKDMIIRSKNMMGYYAPYIPGWDTHGLPIELKAIKEIGVEEASDPVRLRKQCHDFALKHVDIQMNQFKRLGTIADYKHPYITLNKEFEARQIKIFGEMAKKGYIYKGLKPVYWCPDCQTALAEAEIEYYDDPNRSIYVKFKVKDDKGVLTKFGADLDKTYVVIWTTTTWTLPANLAVCFGPKYEYVLVKASNGEYYVLAEQLHREVMKEAQITDYEIVGRFIGSDIEYGTCYHPFIDRDSLMIVGDHVTLDSGTGIVHTAPGHGVEDFEVCKKYPQIPVICPVDNKGKMTKDAYQFEGLTTDQANEEIFKLISTNGSLLAYKKIQHQYPHCWRCKKPIVYRATEQWFCSVDQFRQQTLDAIKDVEWIPDWGQGRMENMVRDRSDWCISRQRTWGVPIPFFYCDNCGKEYISDESIDAVSDLFAKEGSDAWYIKDAMDILPKGTKCPYCGGTKFHKDKDIMDVWFDSGSTHAAVLDTKENNMWPSDLYLEGADQYRGWFQSSLLTSVAWRGVAPYKQVCTHGWVVDGEGKKMSKSLGNGINPDEITDKYGADILRLWVASSDYHADVRISPEILKQLSEVYRKIRNTCRFILSNLNEFNPDTDLLDINELEEIDKWALAKSSELTKTAREAYTKYDFYDIYHAVHNYCTITLSNFYLDVIKDRLYVEATNSKTRRSAQTAIWYILKDLLLVLSPIIPFTVEEVWGYFPKKKELNKEYCALNDMAEGNEFSQDETFMAKWDRISAIRDDVNKALEEKRAEKVIGKALEAKVTINTTNADDYKLLTEKKDALTMIFNVSGVELKNDKDEIIITTAEGEKCERCWCHNITVGTSNKYPTLCARCAKIVSDLSL